jgi:LacI family transcriptional regulator
MSKATIKGIAKALGLSISTVSRALQDSYQISTATKYKVLEYAKSVNYKPDPIAQSLKQKRSYSICVIVPEIANNFFSQVINGIDNAAFEKGYTIFIFQTLETVEREKMGLEMGQQRRADGYIISLSGKTAHYDHLNFLKEENIPTVFFDRVPPHDDVAKVVVDNYAGAYEATKYLIDRGNKLIAHISNHNILSITRERIKGFQDCLRDNHIPFDEKMLKFCGFTNEDAQNAINEVLNEYSPDAFFLSSDRLSLSALAAMKNHPNYKSEQTEIVAFTNMIYPMLLSSNLTTVKQPANEIGNKAVEMLIKQIESKGKDYEPTTIVLKTSLLPSEQS